MDHRGENPHADPEHRSDSPDPGELHIANGVLCHHLRRLEMDGYVKSKVNGRYKHYYPGDMQVPDRIVMLTNFQRALLKTIGEHPGASQAELANAMDIPLSTISRHLQRLGEDGVLTVERSDVLRYRVTPGRLPSVAVGPSPSPPPEPAAGEHAPPDHAPPSGEPGLGPQQPPGS